MDKQQILVIHGGNSFKTYNDYISYLKNTDITLEKIRDRKDWKNKLGKKLGEKFDVFIPQMPNRTNAKYSEWEIMFKKILLILQDNLILIGHSLGGIFLAKYLSQNNISKKVKLVVLVSAPFDEEGDGESLKDFSLDKTISNLNKNYQNIYLIHSQDDNVVSFGQVKKYQQNIPKAKLVVFKNRGHFKQESFPEIIKIIKENIDKELKNE